MSFDLTGKLIAKYDTQQVSDKFKKREFVIETTEDINGNLYSNYAKMQLVQAKCEILDRYKEGDMVKVQFNIKGNSYVDRKDGQTKYISNLDVWSCEAVGAQQSTRPSTYAQGVRNETPEDIDPLPF